MNALPQHAALKRLAWIAVVVAVILFVLAVSVSTGSRSYDGDIGLVMTLGALAGVALLVTLVAGVGATVLSGVRSLVSPAPATKDEGFYTGL